MLPRGDNRRIIGAWERWQLRFQAGKVFDSVNAGHKKVPSAAHLHKAGQAGYASPYRYGLHRKDVSRFIQLARPALPHERIAILVQTTEFRVVDPGLLDELELACDVGIKTEKQQA